MEQYNFHADDYRASTAHLTPVQDIVYRRLLDLYYLREGPLPPDCHAIQRLVGATTQVQCEVVDAVLAEFFELTERGWVNRRCEAEIKAHHAAIRQGRG